MVVTDLVVQPAKLDDTVEIVQLSKPNNVYYASVINHKSLAAFEQLEETLFENKEQGCKCITELTSESNLLKASLALSHARRVAIAIFSQTDHHTHHGLIGILAICKALVTLGKEATLIVSNEEDKKLYDLCIEHMVEIGAFEACAAPTVIVVQETIKNSSILACDCILAIGRNYLHIAHFSLKSNESSQPFDQMFKTAYQNPYVTFIALMGEESDKRRHGDIHTNCDIVKNSSTTTLSSSETATNTVFQADYTISSDCGGYALAYGLYIASTSPFHWRYRNYAINAERPPLFCPHDFLPSTEQVSLCMYVIMYVHVNQLLLISGLCMIQQNNNYY